MEIIRFVKPYAKQFTLGSLAKLAEALLELLLPLLMARIIDVGIPGADLGYIQRMGVLMLLFSLAGLLLAGICQYFAAVTSQGSGTIIRNAIIEKISTFSFSDLDRFGTSSLQNRVTSDVNNVQQAVAMTMRLVTRAPFICVGAVVMSVGIDPGLSLIFAVLIPVLGLIIYALVRKTSPLYRAVQKKLDAFALVVRENLSGVRVIRAFARTGQENRRAHAAAAELADSTIRVTRLSTLMNPATSIVLNLALIAILYLGASRVFSGRLLQGDLLALTTYSTQILYALLVIANLVVLFTKASASSSRIAEVLAVRPSITYPAHSAPAPDPAAPAVRLEGVRFAYGGENALEGVSFSLLPGETMGIVGVTGSGKSTVVNLIQRFYDPQRGAVLLFGAPVQSYPRHALRALIGVAPQNNVLFSGSIADNLRRGKRDATEEEMEQALRTAQCLDFVSALPGGVRAPVQEGGKNFSGGQRQRLAIARALIKRPRLLILDDSLSALDYKTDLELRRALARDLAGTTVIIVSQRISSVLGAHRILVLEQNGRPCGLGTHAELLEACGPYREIYQSQTDSRGGAAANV